MATWPVGAEPSSVVEDRDGKHLFVANRISNDVAVLNAQPARKRSGWRQGAARATSLPRPMATGSTSRMSIRTPRRHRTAPESEITVIDAARAVVVDRIPLHSIAGVFHVAFSADGRLGVAAELHPKNLVPLAHLEHGGAFADTLTLFGADVGNKPVEIPLDELERYAVAAVWRAITPDKSRIYVTSEGSEMRDRDRRAAAAAFIRTHQLDPSRRTSRRARIMWWRAFAVGHDPRGVALTHDGRSLLVANRLEDTISVIDTRSNLVISTIPLEGPKQLSVLRHGEQTFYTARYSFQGQIGCANCHIDSTFDGLNWDLEPDGFGRDIVDNRPIEDSKDTEPYKWNGGNPNLPTECGPRTEKYFWRSENYDDLTLTDLVIYIRSLPAEAQSLASLPGDELSAGAGARQGDL